MDKLAVVLICVAMVTLDISPRVSTKAVDAGEDIDSLPELDMTADMIEETIKTIQLSANKPPSLPSHFSLSFSYNDTELTLVVRRPIEMVSNAIQVEEEAEDTMIEKLVSLDCFYTGTVLEWDGSAASVDVCNNFRSIIVYNGADIYIPKAELKKDIKDEAYNLKFFGEENEGKSRQRRQASNLGERYMEVMIVTDSSVANFHGRNILEQYLITQMNIVNNVYHHPSLGVEINIVVVKILVVDDSTASRFVVRGSGKKTLDHFCQWAASYQSQSPNYDIALYITRHDIGPAGYAPVTGMCNPRRSCAVQKDAGVSSAYVIAHEIGHVIGMGHDGYGNDCSSEPDDGKVMAATVQANFAKFYWTSCSRNSIMHHIGNLYCLNNKPGEQHWPEYSQPYGQTWTLDEQCRQEFGDGYKACRVFEHLDLCNTLWCAKESEPMLCKTKRGPPLPGTECGHNKWCMDGSCVAKKRVSVDGGWSSWSQWSSCSLTCGVGAQTRVRKCNNPSPVHGGRKCSGDSEEVKLCNLQKCDQQTDKRAEMCTKYDNTHYHGNRWHTWVPTETDKVDDQCKLSCISIETGDKLVTDSDVPDGTRCSYDKPHDICVKGSCIQVGCDGVRGSNKYDDRCGVCGGDGSSCKDVYGTFQEELPRKEYHKVLTLPAQARDIVIRENSNTPYLAHFFAVRKEASNQMYLNGRHRQRGSRQFVIEGAKFRYATRGPESLTARGPLLGNVEILVYSLSNKLPCSFNYEYNIPAALENTVTTDIKAEKYDYVWRENGWSECTATCDGGTRSSVFECYEEVHQKVVNDELCGGLEEPTIITEDCNMDPCYVHTYEWSAKEWSPCSRTCGKRGIQLRAVHCMTINLYGTKMNWQVPPEKCKDLPRPSSMKQCNAEPCPADWKVGSWSECSATCGSGTQTRTVSCDLPSDSDKDEYKCVGEQPPDTRICDTKKCPDPTTSTTTTTTSTTTSTTTTPAPTTTSTTTSTTTTTTPTTTTSSTTSAPTTPPTTTTTTATTTTTTTTTKPSTRRTRWWETPTPAPTKKSHPYRRKDNSVELNDKKQQLDIPKYPGNHGSGGRNDRPSHHHRRHHRHQHENSGEVDPKSLLREKYHGQNNEVKEQEKKHPERPVTQKPSPQTDTDRTWTLKNRHSIFSVLTEKHHSRHVTHHHHKAATTTTPTTTAKPERPAFTPCRRDKSVFCRMSLTVEKCHAPIYAKYCCWSCAFILRYS